ncbi:MAG: hypothetical protein WDW38_004381 [Sanguina aurantia]
MWPNCCSCSRPRTQLRRSLAQRRCRRPRHTLSPAHPTAHDHHTSLLKPQPQHRKPRLRHHHPHCRHPRLSPHPHPHHPRSNLPPSTLPPSPPCASRVLRHVMSVLLEHVLCSISDYLPLHAIVARLMGSCGAERFGGLRSTLLSLFSACDYEQTIMGSANRLVTRDVFGVVRAGFRLRTGECAHVTVEAAGEGEDRAGTGLDASSGRAAAFPPQDGSGGYRIGSAAGAAGSITGKWERLAQPSLAPPGWSAKHASGQFKDSGAEPDQAHPGVVRVMQLDTATARMLQLRHGAGMGSGRRSDGGWSAHKGLEYATPKPSWSAVQHAGFGAPPGQGQTAGVGGKFDIDELLLWSQDASHPQ